MHRTDKIVRVELSKLVILEPEKVEKLENKFVSGRSWMPSWGLKTTTWKYLVEMKGAFKHKIPPINAIYFNGMYNVIDGHHRYVLAKKLGRKTMLVHVVPNGTNGITITKDSVVYKPFRFDVT